MPIDYGAISSGSQIASSLISTYYANKAAEGKAKLSNHIRDLNNKTTDVENSRDAAITSLQRWRQQAYNDRVRKNAESDQYAASVNFFRQQDTQTRASFAADIQHAEVQGRMAAAAGASGVTGSVVDMVSSAYRMKTAMEKDAVDNSQKQQRYDFGMRQAATWQANMDQQDFSLIFDSPRQHDIRTDYAKTQSWMTGINVKDIKNVVQGGVNFAFGGSQEDSWTALLNSNRSLGD